MRAELRRGLYAVTPESIDTPSLLRAVEAVLQGGAVLLQYRAKALEPGVALAQARQIGDACRRFQVPFIVNDSIPLALASGADGIHVGREDAAVREARIAMPGAIVGVSCYGDPERARDAAKDGADYVAIGSVFASTTKPQARRAALELIGEARAASGLPVAAIGGITPANVDAVVAAGADFAAVISALFDAADPAEAARAFARAFATPIPGDPDARAQPRAV